MYIDLPTTIKKVKNIQTNIDPHHKSISNAFTAMMLSQLNTVISSGQLVVPNFRLSQQ